jgi:hypothetical protein
MSAEGLSAIAASASAFAAIGALVFTAWQCVEARTARRETERQSRMSVRPLLVFTRAVLNLEKHPVGIFVTNSGLGPATVRRISVVDRISKKMAVGESALAEIFTPISRESGMTSEVQHFWLDEGSGIRPGETVKLLWVNNGSKFQLAMIDLMARVNVKLEYESMYEEPRPPIYLHGPEDFD